MRAFWVFLKRQYWSENRLLWLVAISWLPIFYLYFLLIDSLSPLDFLLGLVAMLTGYGAMLWVMRRQVRRPLLTLSNLLMSLQEGDYGLKARQYHGVLGEVLLQSNHLTEILKALRIGEREAHLLLSKMISAIDLAIFIFNHRDKLSLANPHAEQLLMAGENDLKGQSAEDLNLAMFLAQDGEVVEHQFPGGVGRWRVRSFVFFQDKQQHRLLVMSDVSSLLVEEERSNWKRLLRVLSHELNNSLVPIKNMSQTLGQLMGKHGDSDIEWQADLQKGIALMGRRSDALHRFIQGYAQLTRLPAPNKKWVSVEQVVNQVTALENIARVQVQKGPDIELWLDPDQIEQVLLNLLTNAMDATQGNQGNIIVTWQLAGKFAQISVADFGTGILNMDNIFVPFFTTKPDGSGIGLVLCKQIVESHGGQITLQSGDRQDAFGQRGCQAIVLLPVALDN